MDVSTHWKETHTAELVFAEQKAASRKLQAQREGALLPDEEATCTPGAADAQIQNMLQALGQRRRAERRHSTYGQADMPDVVGMRAYLGSGVDSLPPRLRKLRWTIVDSVVGAEVLVIAHASGKWDHKNPDVWAAALQGMYLVILGTSSSSSANAVAADVVLKYKQATRLPASIYATPAFRTAHPDHARIVRRCALAATPTWKILRNRAAFVAGDARKQARTIAVTAAGDGPREDRQQKKG